MSYRQTDSGAYDGVICFGGGDWWYHNRGHYDMQMMRSFSRRVPVLYVNSNGVRIPRVGEGRMFLRRVRRKLRSLARGFVRASDRFGVLSPGALPGPLGWKYSRRLIAAQARRAGRKMGIQRPLIWITCPPAVELLRHFAGRPVVYQRTDRWECFPGCNPAQIRGYHARLSSSAALTLFCSRLLFKEEAAGCRDALFVDHGVDYDDFASAGDGHFPEPEDLVAIGRPRAGFIGGIDGHTFDPSLFLSTARALPDVQFVVVGACSLPRGWCELPNVALLGQRPYEQVARYMAACDVLIMPWNRNEWINACNPVKLKEYLAVGRPVVSTPFDELKYYAGSVLVAQDAAQFVSQLRAAIAQGSDPALQRQLVQDQTWEAKHAQVVRRLEETGWCLSVPAATQVRTPVGLGGKPVDTCQAKFST